MCSRNTDNVLLYYAASIGTSYMHHDTYGLAQIKLLLAFYLHICVPRGDGPLPEVSAILGQPVRKTKQALYIPRSTKIEEQLVPEGTYQLLH